jgi:hypothetical protein
MTLPGANFLIYIKVNSDYGKLQLIAWENLDLGVLTPSPPIEGATAPPLKLPRARGRS